MRQTMPERIYAQEILATFLDDAGGVFRGVINSATASISKPEDGKQYVYGVDWGKHNDYTVIVVLDPDTKKQVYLDRFNQIDYHLQTSRLKSICEQYKPLEIIAERNSMGEPLIEHLQRESLPVSPFTTTNASKAQAVESLSMAFERNQIEVINDPDMIAELQAYEATRLPSGMLRYSAPNGLHDDCVMALALAWTGVSQEGNLLLW
jgi:hypothetical protein